MGKTMLRALAALVIASSAWAAESLIRNGTFNRDLEGWSSWFAPDEAEGKAEWVPRGDGGALHVQVGRRERPTAVQIYQGPFQVKQGHWLAVSFEVKTGRPGAMDVALIRHGPPYGGLGLRSTVAVGPQWEHVGLLAAATRDSDAARLDFFPATTLWLDNVAVADLGAEPPACHVRSVRLGPGWRGKARALTDGNAKTHLASQYYPVLPLLVTLDLGAPQPVGAVVVEAQDRGRHTYLGRFEVEVSADGEDWRRWAAASRHTWGAPTAWAPYCFTATNLAVTARYVRLRVTRLRGRAVLAEARVLRAPGGARSPEALPPVPAEEDLAFQGWDYEAAGYALSPGEPLALRFVNQGERQVQVPLAWRLETYDGEEVGGGRATVSAPPRGPGRFSRFSAKPLEGSPTVTEGLPDGPYRLRFRLGQGDEQAFYFDWRVPKRDAALSLRLAALLDCLDPEGWVRLAAGPFAPYWNVRRTVPDDLQHLDAALVMAENWPSEDRRLQSLRRVLAAGGTALFFGKVAPSLAPLLPVEVDRDSPWLDTPQRLSAPSFWPGFALKRCPPQYGIRVRARPGAKVLARWEGGTPAVVEGAVGPGRTLYVAAPLGRLWQHPSPFRATDELAVRALYYLVSRAAAPDTLARHTAALAQRRSQDEDRIRRTLRLAPEVTVHKTVASHPEPDNIGRFGWRFDEGGLVENLGADGTMTCPTDPAPWRLTVPGLGPLRPGRPVFFSWMHKAIPYLGPDGEEVLEATVSLGAPCILWEGEARRVDIAGPFTHVAVPTADGVRVLGRGEHARGADTAANWLVLLRAQEDVRDVPRLVALTRRPARIALGKTLRLDFGERAFDVLWTGRVYGIRRFAEGETAGWTARFPKDVAAQAARVARLCLLFPIGTDEYAWREGERIALFTEPASYQYENDWGVPLPNWALPLPPALSLARRHGFPVEIDGDISDTGVATKYGPLEMVANGTGTCRLPLPPRDHFGLIPVEGQMAFAAEIDRRALQGIRTVKRASGGLTTGDPFLADLRPYITAGQHPPFESPHLDLYKWWYCFPTVLGRPAYGPAARPECDAHHRLHYWTTLNYYPHKALIRARREPFTGLDYAISFIWPVSWRDGVRYFCDQNESASVILYCLWAYANYHGDWATARANWPLAQYVHRYLTRFHDWATMTSSNQEYFSTVGIDMLNSEYPGHLAYARIARQVGDAEAEARGLALAAKALVPALARLHMPDYIRSITAEGDPLRERRYFWSFHETDLRGQTTLTHRGGPEFVAHIAGGVLDTSKGTSPEICLLYKHFVRDRIEAYERDVRAFERQHDVGTGWAHAMMRAFLRWPREELVAGLRRFHEHKPDWGWQSTKAPHNLAAVCVADTPLFLAQWAPAEYVAGRFTPADRTVRLTFRNHEAGACVVRLYSRCAPREVRLNGQPCRGWTYDETGGWLAVPLRGPGEARLEIRLGEEPAAPLHPYFVP